jgi:hypothetical protein
MEPLVVERSGPPLFNPFVVSREELDAIAQGGEDGADESEMLPGSEAGDGVGETDGLSPSERGEGADTVIEAGTSMEGEGKLSVKGRSDEREYRLGASLIADFFDSTEVHFPTEALSAGADDPTLP